MKIAVATFETIELLFRYFNNLSHCFLSCFSFQEEFSFGGPNIIKDCIVLSGKGHETATALDTN